MPTRRTQTTPYERWNGLKAKVKHLQIFRLKCFVHIPTEKRRKLDNVAKQMIFVGYDENSKGYRCYDPVQRKITISRDVRFANVNMDDKINEEIEVDVRQSPKLSINEGSDSDTDFESCTESRPNNRENEANEDRDDNSRSNVAESDAENNFQEEASPHQPRRISQRSTKGIAPHRLNYDTMKITDDTKEPRSLSEALSSENKTQWVRAMEEEMKSLMKNKTWKLCKLPEDRTAIGCKWVYKAKEDTKGKVRFKARLVAQGFTQRYGLDYDQIFAPVARQATFRTLLAIASKEKYVVKHLDFKTAFLNGKIKEEIYMKQPPGFIKNEEEQLVCLLQKSIYGLKQAAKS